MKKHKVGDDPAFPPLEGLQSTQQEGVLMILIGRSDHEDKWKKTMEQEVE